VSGAIAERAKFEAYICYSFFMASWVYPVRRRPHAFARRVGDRRLVSRAPAAGAQKRPVSCAALSGTAERAHGVTCTSCAHVQAVWGSGVGI